MLKLRVQFEQRAVRDLQLLRERAQVSLTGYHACLVPIRIRGRYLEAILLWCLRNGHHRKYCWNVVASLLRDVAASMQSPKVSRARTGDRVIDIALARVVGGKRERPVSVVTSRKPF